MIIKRKILSNLQKNLCCGYSLDLPSCRGEAILMSTHTIGFYEEISKIISSYHKIPTLSVLLNSHFSGYYKVQCLPHSLVV